MKIFISVWMIILISFACAYSLLSVENKERATIHLFHGTLYVVNMVNPWMVPKEMYLEVKECQKKVNVKVCLKDTFTKFHGQPQILKKNNL